MELLLLSLLASRAFSLPVNQDVSPVPVTNAPSVDWPGLSEAVKSTILDRFSPDVLAKLSLTSKQERHSAETYLSNMRNISESDKLPLFMEAAKTGNTALYDLLMFNRTKVAINDPEVLLAACESGTSVFAKDFFGPSSPKILIPFYSKAKLKKDCGSRAVSAGRLRFLQETGIVLDQSEADLKSASSLALIKKHSKLALYLSRVFPDMEMFQMAACKGDVQVMKEILAGPVLRPDLLDSHNFEQFQEMLIPHPVACAAANGHVDAVKYLLSLKDAGAPIDLAYHENAAFWRALKSGKIEIVKLIEAYPEVDPFANPGLFLNGAVGSKNLEIVQWYFAEAKRRGIILSRVHQGVDVLMVAPSVPILKELMKQFDCGVNLDGLHYAINGGYDDVVQIYLMQPIEEFQPNALVGALNAAISLGKVDIVNSLLQKMRDIIQPFELNDALIVAAAHGHSSVVKILVDAGADPNQDGIVLRDAFASGQVNVVKYLLELENVALDPAADENRGLIDAASFGNLEMVKYLISLKSKYPNIDPSDQNNSAFIGAIKNDHVSVAQYLVSLKPKFPGINPGDNDNEALKIAISNKQSHLVDYLLSLPAEMGIDHSLVPNT